MKEKNPQPLGNYSFYLCIPDLSKVQEKCEQFETKIRIAIVCYFCFYIIILVQILVDLVRDQLKTVQRDNRRRNPTRSHEMHQRRYQPGRSR